MRTSGSLAWLTAAALLLVACAPSVAAQDLNEPPTVTIEHPEEDATVEGTVEARGNASDPDGNVSHVQVRIDDGDWVNATGTENWTYAWDTTDAAEGEHTIHARSYDGETYSPTADRNVTVDNAGDGGNGTENLQPTVAIHHPGAGATVDGTVEVRGNASDPDGNISRVRVRVDEAPWQDADGTRNWSITWDSTTADDGEHLVTVEATDDEDATTTAERVVTVDNRDGDSQAPPSVAITSPSEGATVNGTIEVTGTTSDPDGNVTALEARIDDGAWEPVDPAQTWSFPLDAANLTEGEHTVTVRATDGAGASAAASRNVTVETSRPPALTIQAPSPNATVNGTVEIRGNASSPDGSIDRVEIRIGDGPWQPARGTATWAFRWDASRAEAGEHRITVRAIDDGGTGTNETRVVQVQPGEGELTATSALTLSLAAPEDGATVTDTLTLAGEVGGVQEDGVVVRVSYRIDNGSARVIEVPGGGGFEQEVNVTHLDPGDHQLAVQALHGESTSGTQTASFEVEEAGGPPTPETPLGLVLFVIAVLVTGGLVIWARRAGA